MGKKVQTDILLKIPGNIGSFRNQNQVYVNEIIINQLSVLIFKKSSKDLLQCWSSEGWTHNVCNIRFARQINDIIDFQLS